MAPKHGDEWQDVEEPVVIRWRDCRYGGRRPYFVCPGVVNGAHCGRHTVKLHCAGRYYLCRHCYRLSHASRNESSCDRSLRRANKIRTKLGGEAGLSSPDPATAQGHVRTNLRAADAEAFDREEAHAEERLADWSLPD